jgi:hypothetical protein
MTTDKRIAWLLVSLSCIICAPLIPTQACVLSRVDVNVVVPPGPGRFLTPDDVAKHIQELVVFSDPSQTHWSCVDGRGSEPVFATPAGDSGELLLGFAILEKVMKMLQPDFQGLSQQDIRNIFDEFLSGLDPNRRFYMHTDVHALERLQQAYNITELQIEAPDPSIQPLLLQILTQPPFIGCGHLRLCIQRPDLYQVRADLTRGLISSFYDYMWNYNNSKLHHLTDLVELQGDHKEKAVVTLISDTSALPPNDPCENKAPMVPGHTDLNSFFLDHAAYVNYGIRNRIGQFIAQKLRDYNPGVAIDDRTIIFEMNTLADIQLEATIQYLAANEPIYSSTLYVQPSSSPSDTTGFDGYSTSGYYGSTTSDGSSSYDDVSNTTNTGDGGVSGDGSSPPVSGAGSVLLSYITIVLFVVTLIAGFFYGKWELKMHLEH